MKKALYMILLIAGFVVSFGLPALATTATGRAYFLIVAAVWVSVMVLLLAKLKKTPGVERMRKPKAAIALCMLLPPCGRHCRIHLFCVHGQPVTSV